MTWQDNLLAKKGWRSDRFWTNKYVYRSFFAYVPLFADTFVLMRSQFWARDRLDRLRDARLRTLFEDVRSIPLWRDRFSGAGVPDDAMPLEILAKLPITSKRDLTDVPLEQVADLHLIGASDPDHTSGSTGKPLHFYQDWNASLRSCAVTERTFRTATAKRYPIVYMRSKPRNGFTFYRHIWFYLRSFNSVAHRVDDFVRLSTRLRRGFVLYGYTSWVLELARQLDARRLRVPIRAVMVAGEHVTPHDRAYIERALHAELFTLYASRETGFLGFECEHHRMHINEEWAHIEILDDSGEPVGAGERGRIIVTTFDNRVMPFIRFEIGDVGSISADACPCGRTLRTLDFQGRTAELIDLGDDRTVTLLDVSYALGTYRDAIRHYQIIQKGQHAFTIRVVVGASFNFHREYLEGLMIRLMHPKVQITWDVVDAIPEAESGKAVYFVRDFT